MRKFNEQNDKQSFWRFTISYNVILLGVLYLAIQLTLPTIRSLSYLFEPLGLLRL